MIYTGYISRLNYYVSRGLIPIFVCRYVPETLKSRGVHYLFLAPSCDLLRLRKSKLISWEEYCERYTKELNNLLISDESKTFNLILSNLNKCDKDIVLLCYEKDPKQCHRSLLGTWLRRFIDHDITEFI